LGKGDQKGRCVRESNDTREEKRGGGGRREKGPNLRKNFNETARKQKGKKDRGTRKKKKNFQQRMRELKDLSAHL